MCNGDIELLAANAKISQGHTSMFFSGGIGYKRACFFQSNNSRNYTE